MFGVGLRNPIDLPGEVDLSAALGGQGVDHVVEPPARVPADLEAVALGQLHDRLLLARGKRRSAARCQPDDVMEVQVPDARGDQLAPRLDLDHARRKARHVALGGRAGGEDAGVAGAADLLRVGAGLRPREQVQVLTGMDRDRVRPARIGGHVGVARRAEDLLAGARGGGEGKHRRERSKHGARDLTAATDPSTSLRICTHEREVPKPKTLHGAGDDQDGIDTGYPMRNLDERARLFSDRSSSRQHLTPTQIWRLQPSPLKFGPHRPEKGRREACRARRTRV